MWQYCLLRRDVPNGSITRKLNLKKENQVRAPAQTRAARTATMIRREVERKTVALLPRRDSEHLSYTLGIKPQTEPISCGFIV